MPRPVLKTEAVELSTYEVPISFTDSANQPATPDSVVWSLSTLAGAIVNGRSQVAATPAAEMWIVLSGEDLALLPGELNMALPAELLKVQRLLTVEAIYSSTEGSGLPLKEEIQFGLRALVVPS